MKLRNHVGSILFVVLAIASGVYAAVEGRSDRTSAGKDDLAVFPKLDERRVTKIEIERDGARLVLERARAEEPFRMTSPVPGAVDPATIEQLLAVLEHATVARVVPGAAPSGAPRARATITTAEGALRFALAEPAPVPEGAAYIDFEDGRRVVVRRELAAELLRPFDAYRDRALVTVPPSEVETIEARGAEGSALIQRQDDLVFRIPNGPRVARDVVERWLGALPELRATAFLGDVAESARTPKTVLTVTAHDGRRSIVTLAGPCPTEPSEVVALVPGPPPIVACVPSAGARVFEVAPSALADRRLFALRADEVAELAIDASSGAALSIARTGGGFRERRPDSRDLDAAESDAASAFVARLLAAEGTIANAPSTSGAPALRISLVRAGTDKPEVVDVFDTNKAAFAKRAADGAWLELPPEMRRALDPPPSGIRAPWLLGPSFNTDTFRRIASRCGGNTTTVVRGETGYVLESPAGAPVDAARVVELLELLSRTRGRETVAVDRASPAAACSTTIAWTEDGGASEVQLSFVERGSDAGRTLVVRKAAERDGMVVGEALREALGEPLVDRGAIAWQGEPPERVTVVRGNAPVALDTAGESAVRTSLGQLRATRVLRVGAALPEEGFAAPFLEIRASRGAAAPVVYRFARPKEGGGVLVRKTGLDVTFRIADDMLPLVP